MKQSVLDGNLQILLRSQEKKQQALSCFFDTKVCHEMYPEEVTCKKTGVWVKDDSGSQRTEKNMYKVWATYSRKIITEETTDGEETSEVLVS